jgi:acyl transferase domain-containing protein/protein-L-isoaspartate O-methyltransferase/acyl carrier protein
LTDMPEFLDRISKLSPKKLALLARDLQSKLDSLEKEKREPIAIIGMGCRFPGGANSPEQFWQLLRDGVDAVSEVPPDRWDVNAFYDPDPGASGKMSTRYGAFIETIDQFDPQFFGISPREAVRMDPQQRWLLEVSWEALENAGESPDRLEGSKTGVFVGICSTDYAQIMMAGDQEAYDVYVATGGSHAIASGRLSYVLGLHGPSIALDTACSSSLAAIHLACLSLRAGECRAALAGGVNTVLLPDVTIMFSKAGMMAVDGRCKAFDASADGFVRGEGCGMILLKRLSHALEDGNNILALILGSAANQDGRSSGITAPNGLAQQAVIREALESAGIGPSEVDYVETHGTGTSLGDPIEVIALGAVLGKGRTEMNRLKIGSVKTNLGHVEGAAGVAGLIKLVLALQYKHIPPHLHLKKLNPYIPWEELPIDIPTQLTPWPLLNPRRIGAVSSFGFSGTNVHIIAAEAPERKSFEPTVDRTYHLLNLSAKRKEALRESAVRFEHYLAENPSTPLPDLCYTASTGRSHFDHRLSVIAASSEEMRQKIAALLAGEECPGIFQGWSDGTKRPEVVFLFSGQGGQYLNMGRQLFEIEPTFRNAIHRCAELLRPHLEMSLLSVLYPDAGASTPLDETRYTHPAMFAVQYALAELWRSWGIEPSLVMGHSVGEIVAATVAGMMSLEEGLMIMRERGRLMQSLPKNGLMASVMAGEQRVLALLSDFTDRVAIAAVNGPESTVISGERAAVEKILRKLEDQGVKTKPLKVSHSFHSPLVDPVLDEFERLTAHANFVAPKIPVFSSMRLEQASGDSLLDSKYWRQNLRSTVRFHPAIRALFEQGYRVFLEIGPSPILTGMGSLCIPEGTGTWLPSLREGRDEWDQMLTSLGMLYICGTKVDWSGLYKNCSYRRVALPTYPFQRQRYWIEASKSARRQPPQFSGGESYNHPLLGRQIHSALKETLFESHLDLGSLSYLDAHRVYGSVIMPAPAYLEMALTVAREVFGQGSVLLRDVMIHEALVIPDDETKAVQTIITPPVDSVAQFQIFSRYTSHKEPQWKLHASGKIQVGGEEESPGLNQHDRLETIRERCQEEVSADAYYHNLERSGVVFGRQFRGIEKLWRREGEALGHVRLADELGLKKEPYQVHPALLDGCFHVIGASLQDPVGQNAGAGTFLMIGLDSFRLLRGTGNQVWSHSLLRPIAGGTQDMLVGDLTLFDEAGDVIAELQGIHLKRAAPETLLRATKERFDNWLYELEWQLKPHSGHELPRLVPDYIPSLAQIAERVQLQVPLLSDQFEMGTYCELLRQLESLGMDYVLWALQQLGWKPHLGEQVSVRSLAVKLGIADQYHRLLNRMLEMMRDEGIVKPSGEEWVVDRVPVFEDPTNRLQGLQMIYPPYDAELTLVERCGASLSEVLQGRRDPLSLLFPNGSIDTVEKLSQDSPAAQAYNRLFESAISTALEGLPKDRTLRILEIGAGTGSSTTYVIPHVPLERSEYFFTDVSQMFLSKAKQKFQRYPFMRYQLLDIEVDPAKQGFPPQQFDVVLAANVLHATSDLHQSLKNIQRLLTPGGLMVLMEGTGPQRWVDITFGLTKGWWRFSDTKRRVSHPLLPHRQWLDLIEEVGFTEGVAIPRQADDDHKFTQQSVVMARCPQADQAELRGSSVSVVDKERGRWMILADRGGIGQKLSEEFVSRGQTCILVSQGGTFERLSDDRLIIDPARSEDFQQLFEEVRKTNNPPLRGVIHLFSLDAPLADDTTLEELEDASTLGCRSALYLLQALVAAKFPNATRLWLVTKSAQPVGDTASVLSLAQSPLWGLGRVAAMEHPELWGGLLDLDRNDPGFEAPSIFAEICEPDGEDQVAFRGRGRYVARLRHSQIQHARGAPIRFHADATYLITGGLGGMGLKLARWLTERGARNLVLVARRSATSEAQEVVRDLESLGARVVTAQADVSKEPDVARILSMIRTSMPPLCGIIHAAGIFDDRVLVRHEWDRFARVLAPKVSGGWNLHLHSRDLPLDFFVLFSSAASFLGPIGLGNYTAANSFLDALAYHRKSHGLPALSIDWGPWKRVGMAEAVGEKRESQWSVGGFGTMHAEHAMDLMGQLMQEDLAQVGVLPVEWSKFMERFGSGQEPRLFSALAREAKSRPGAERDQAQPELIRRLEAALPRDRWDTLVSYIHDLSIKVLGFDKSYALDIRQGFFDIGMDSLTAVELKNYLQTSVGRSLPSTVVFDYPNIYGLADYIAREIPSLKVSRESQIPEAGRSQEAKVVPESRENLSEEELTALLAEKLKQIR